MKFAVACKKFNYSYFSCVLPWLNQRWQHMLLGNILEYCVRALCKILLHNYHVGLQPIIINVIVVIYEHCSRYVFIRSLIVLLQTEHSKIRYYRFIIELLFARNWKFTVVDTETNFSREVHLFIDCYYIYAIRLKGDRAKSTFVWNHIHTSCN